VGRLECNRIGPPRSCLEISSIAVAFRANWEAGGTVLGTILIVLLIFALLGALPRWPHSRSWGYFPTGGLGLVLLIVIVLVLLGRL
jgi:Protein of unknown function (DUF3309)